MAKRCRAIECDRMDNTQDWLQKEYDFWALHDCNLHTLDVEAKVIKMGDSYFFQTGEKDKEFFQSVSVSLRLS